MYPILKDGEMVLVKKNVHGYAPRDIIVCHHPFRRMIIVKYIGKILPDGSIRLEGAAVESEDAIGPVPKAAIVGKVIAKI